MALNTTSRTNVSLISSTSCFDGIISINATAQLPIKLNNNNFPSWKAQFDALYGYDLMGFLDGNKTCPSKEIIAEDGTTVSNPDFVIWTRQDKLLLHAILASLSEGVVPLIAAATSSRDAWVKLHKLYANKSRSRVMNLKEKLTNITCNTAYIASIFKPLKELDFCAIRARETPISFEELHDKCNNGKRFFNNRNSQGRKFNNNGNHNNHFQSNVVCQFCQKKKGHTTRQCHSARRLLQQQPEVHHTSFGNSSSSNWIMDSSASHHVIGDLTNLSHQQPYEGPDDILLGNGLGLEITHTGSSKLLATSKSFCLSNVLCVPSIKQNLISVSKFCKTNNTSIEFFPSSFVIKDLKTGARLTQGRSKDDVYDRVSVKTSLANWHHRLGHPSSRIFQFLIRKHNLQIYPIDHKLPFGVSSLRSRGPLDLVYSDVWGPSPIESIDGFRYYLIFIDYFTKYVWLFPMAYKSDVYSFPKYKSMVEKYFNASLVTLYTDGGTEYKSLKSYFISQGIQHQVSPPYTPEHVGSAERKHRHVVETGLAMLHKASLPLKYWSYAFLAAAYLINRLPTPILKHQSPFESLFQHMPNYDKLRAFGCLCFPWMRPYSDHKLDKRSKPCVFLGYSNTHNAYKCLDLSSNRVYISRHVQFIEHKFPFASNTTPTDLDQAISTWSSCSPALAAIQPSFFVVPTSSKSFPHQAPSCTNTGPNQELISSLSPTSSSPPTTASAPLSACDAPPRYDLSLSSLPVSFDSSNISSPSLSLSPPTQPQGSNPLPEPSHRIVTRSQNNIHCPKQFPDFKTSFHVTKHPLPASLEPTTASQALKDPKWCATMDDELALARTWVLVPPPSNHNIVGCNPVVKPTTIRVVLSIALSNSWPISQLDVNNAFLHGTLTEDVYMAQPPGYVDQANPTHVCRLQKALYGLKQAPRAWYMELRTFLLTFGFINSKSDTSLFIYQCRSATIYFLVYVDDLLVTGNCSQSIRRFIDALAHRFSLKDLGPLSYFLGVEAISTSDGMFLSQHQYVRDLLAKFNLEGIKDSSTPMSSTGHLTLNDGSPLANATQFRSLIGGLQYLQLTRLDIAFAVNKLAQFMHAPTQTHWTAAKRLLRYLKHTIHLGLTFRRQQPLHLQAYSDSTTAFVLFLGGHPISYHLGFSSPFELGITLQQSPTIYCDNLSATYLCVNPLFHEKVADGSLKVSHVNTQSHWLMFLPNLVPKVGSFSSIQDWHFGWNAILGRLKLTHRSYSFVSFCCNKLYLT
ncbi:hypothetical protein AAG906_020728 [Vitis piasezkii]